MELRKAITEDFYTIKEVITNNRLLMKGSNWLDYNLLTEAVRQKKTGVVELLIQNKCRVNKTTKNYVGNTPLHYAVDTEVYIDDSDLLRLLLEKGALPDALNGINESPIHVVAKKIIDIFIDNEMIKEQLSLLFEKSMQRGLCDLKDNTGFTYLHAASICGDRQIVKVLMDNHANINAVVKSGFFAGRNALHFCVNMENYDLIDVLLRYGCNPHLRDGFGNTPLHSAFKTKKKEAVEKLLKTINENTSNMIDRDGLSYLHIACASRNTKVVELLQIKKVDVEENSPRLIHSDLPTPLHYAVESGCTKAVKLILDENVTDIFVKNKKGQTPLHLAHEKKHEKIVDLILGAHNRTNFSNPSNDYGCSHFHIACSRNKPDIVEGFLKADVSVDLSIPTSLHNLQWPDFKPLHIAVESQLVKNVKILLQFKANVNAKNAMNSTALHIACQGSNNQLIKLKEKLSSGCKPEKLSIALNSVKNDQLEIVQLLLSHKCSINSKNDLGLTPLLASYVFRNDTEILEVLKKFNTIRKSDEYEECAIKALSLRHKHLVNTLIDHGADVTVTDEDGKTILHRLLETNEKFIKFEEGMMEIYVNKGVDINSADIFGRSPLEYAIIKKHYGFSKVFFKFKVNLNFKTKDAYGDSINSPFHDLVELSKNADKFDELSDIIDAFIANGVDINAKGTFDSHMLHIALSDENIWCSEIFKEEVKLKNPLARKLLQYDCDINTKDINGMTPLHYAICEQDLESVPLLLRLGADVNLCNDSNQTPLSMSKGENSFLHFFILNHLKKLSMLKMEIHKKNVSAYKFLKYNNWDESKFLNLKKLLNHDFCMISTSQCLAEIRLMKNVSFCWEMTLYDILFKSPREMALYAENRVLKNVIEGKDFEEKFPLYGFLIKLQYQKGLKRNALIQPAQDFLYCFARKNIPDLCVLKIFEFLENSDLKNIIIAKGLVSIQKTEAQITTRSKSKRLQKSYFF